MVGLPSKFHEGTVPKQPRQEIRHRAGGTAVKTALSSHLENKELKTSNCSKQGARAVPRDRSRYFQVYIPCPDPQWPPNQALALPFHSLH